MNKQVKKLLNEAGVWREFVVMMMLRSPFDICNSILTANMMQKFMRLIEQNQSENLGKTLGVFFVLTVLLFGYNMTIWSTIAVRFTVKLQKTLREKMFDKIMSLPADELMGSSKAEWFTRLNNDIDKAVGYLVSPINFMHMVIASVNLVISSVIMIFLSVELYIIGICCLVPFFMFNVFVISAKINVFRKEAQKSLVGYTDWIDVTLKEKEMLAVYDAKDFARERISQKSTGILNRNMKAHNRGAVCNMFYAFSGMLGYLLLLYKGNGIIEKKLDDFADLCKVTQYRGRLVLSFNCVLNSVINMRGSLVGVERVNEVLSGGKDDGRTTA